MVETAHTETRQRASSSSSEHLPAAAAVPA
jgi:hypothetical protein